MDRAVADVPVAPTPSGFRRPFRTLIAFDVRTGVALLVLFTAVRVALVLQANVTGSYQSTSVVFVAMAVVPFLLLDRDGRRRIGLVRPSRWRWVPVALVAGAACAVATFALATVVFGLGLDNPFVYIARSYSAVPAHPGDTSRLVYFIIFAVIGVTFSPIGEELFYRGLVHESLATEWGNRTAAAVEGGAFALAHLAHFGIVYIAGAWALLPLPAVLWVAAMLASALVFYGFRVATGSLLGAMLAHAGFNLVMNYVIFFIVL